MQGLFWVGLAETAFPRKMAFEERPEWSEDLSYEESIPFHENDKYKCSGARIF